MENYEKHVDEVLERHGVDPKQPMVLKALGKEATDIYERFYQDIRNNRKASDGMTATECQMKAMDFTCKHLSIIKKDEWRDDYKKNGYVEIYSPLFKESFYLCRDKQTFKKLNRGDLVVFMESELPKLRGLEDEDLVWLYEGKKFKGVLV